MKTKLLLITLLILVCCIEIHPQANSVHFLKRLAGTWQGDGKAFGSDARMRLEIEEVLGNKFVRLSVRNEMRAANSQSYTRSFEGHAYYRLQTDDTYLATWFDSRGVTFPIKGKVEGNALIAFWGTPEQEQGKSVYRILEPGKLEVIDAVLQKDGSWKEFGKFAVTRLEPK